MKGSPFKWVRWTAFRKPKREGWVRDNSSCALNILWIFYKEGNPVEVSTVEHDLVPTDRSRRDTPFKESTG